MRKIQIKSRDILQFIKFGLVGVSNTALSYGIIVLVLFLLRNRGLSWDYVAANTVAFLLSVLWSFYWNNRSVFKSESGRPRSIAKALLKTYASYAFTGIVLNNVLSWFFITQLGISKYLAPLLNLMLTVPINFLLNRNWAFSE